MKKLVRALVTAAVVAACGSASPALAQYPPQPWRPGPAISQPVVSPYLNLLRPGNLAVNYYGLVRPEIEFNQSINRLSSQLNAVGQLAQSETGGLGGLATGHPISFMNYSHYYPQTRGGMGGGGGFGRPGGTSFGGMGGVGGMGGLTSPMPTTMGNIMGNTMGGSPSFSAPSPGIRR